MKPYYEGRGVVLYHGDSREVCADLQPVEAIVSDPPYGLAFMGKAWDHGVPDAAAWRAILRAVKPGAHVVAFGGTRTFHRLACALEDAGLELRDCLSWLYGQGFPKSMDVSKAIDKAAGVEFEKVPAEGVGFMNPDGAGGWNPTQNRLVRKIVGSYEVTGTAARDSGGKGVSAFRTSSAEEPEPPVRKIIGEREVHDITRPPGGGDERLMTSRGNPQSRTLYITEPATEAAKKWNGWGTALKPAWEPILLARAPLPGTVAACVQLHGTGAINIDASRVPYVNDADREQACVPQPMFNSPTGEIYGMKTGEGRNGETFDSSKGRFPANVILDPVAGEMLDAQSGYSESIGWINRPAGGQHGRYGPIQAQGIVGGFPADAGGASRFFYCAKAGAAERGDLGNSHPTVKPLELMRWLVQLVTPIGGTVLDPFAGSGTTLLAARDLFRKAIGVELEERYCEMAARRLEDQPPLLPFEGFE